MKLTLFTLALAAFTVTANTLKPTFQQHDQHTQTKRYLIQFNHDISPLESPLVSGEQRIYNLDGNTKRLMHKQNIIAAELSASAVKQLQNDPNIALIEEDPVRKLAHKGDINYGTSMVQAPLVPDTASSNQTVCVIDTGYDANHEDLPSGANITGEVLDATGGARELGDWFEDTYGHGTHITGTLAALGNNIGLEGILPSGALNIHHVKVVDHKGYWRFYGSDVIAAVNACESAGATVVNMSLAGWTESQVEQSALQTAYDNGMLLVAAGGNFGSTQYAYPASYDAVISVGAIDKNQNAWMFTQQNNQIELVAPGVEVNSTLPNNRYGKWDGTSVAAPYVSGVAALVWSNYPSCNNQNIREVLQATALNLGEAEKDETYGFGLVQAKAAYDLIATQGCFAASSDKEFDNKDEFDEETTTTLIEDFEDWFPIQKSIKSRTAKGIEWTATTNLYILIRRNSSTSAPVESKVLASNGVENFKMTFQQPRTAVGFNFLDNAQGNNKIDIVFTDGSEKTFIVSGDHTALNFWGFRSSKPMRSLNWFNGYGGVVNTALDNIHLQ